MPRVVRVSVDVHAPRYEKNLQLLNSGRRPSYVRSGNVVAVVPALALAACSSNTSQRAEATASDHAASRARVGSTTPGTHTTRRAKHVRAPQLASCGPWARGTSPTEEGLSTAHGRIENCVGFEGAWFVFQLGARGVNGGVEEFHCATASCTPSSVVFQSSRWTYLAPPFAGSVTLLDAEARASWSVDNTGHELLFHPATGTFSLEQPAPKD